MKQFAEENLSRIKTSVERIIMPLSSGELYPLLLAFMRSSSAIQNLLEYTDLTLLELDDDETPGGIRFLVNRYIDKIHDSTLKMRDDLTYKQYAHIARLWRVERHCWAEGEIPCLLKKGFTQQQAIDFVDLYHGVFPMATKIGQEYVNRSQIQDRLDFNCKMVKSNLQRKELMYV